MVQQRLETGKTSDPARFTQVAAGLIADVSDRRILSYQLPSQNSGDRTDAASSSSGSGHLCFSVAPVL